MLMADTMAIFFVFLGMLLAFPGLWLSCRGLWPSSVNAMSLRCERRIWPSFLVGILTTTVMVFISILMLKLPGPIGKIATIGFVSLFVLHASLGVSGIATTIGKRLRSPSESSGSWRSTLLGGVALELAYLLPILGWFVILPSSLIIGSGLAFQTLPYQLKAVLHSSFDRPELTSAQMSGEKIELNIEQPFGAA
jgi:hypothetical protein